MKALVLAAGFGTRLKSITEGLPKCLVEVAGKTMLERTVDALKNAAVTEIVINLHYRGEQIREFVASKNSFGIKVHFSAEPEILGTGGGLWQARDFLAGSEPFFIHNSDVYSELDLKKLATAHSASSAVATLAVMDRPSDRVLLFDEDGELLGYENRKEKDRVVVREGRGEKALGFSGIQICSSSVFEFMKNETPPYSSIRVYLNAARAGASVKGCRMEGAYWIDMGTPERLEQLRARLA